MNVDRRLAWDKNIQTIERVPMQRKNCFVNYQQNVGKLNIGNRDYIDKLIYFADTNKFYAY